MTNIKVEYRKLLAGTHSQDRVHNVHFYVYSVSLDEGRGDVFVALGLARALDAIGWGVSFSDYERWNEPLSADTSVTVSMLPTVNPDRTNPDVLHIGWARNAVDEWCAQAHLEHFDGLLASSQSASDELLRSYFGPSEVMPIAVDPDLFMAGEGSRGLSIVTTVNYWGQDRGLISDLRSIEPSENLHWFGTNLQELEVKSSKVKRYEPVSYLDVPALYRDARIVLDDLTISSRRFACHNSRLFESLAAGALVVTNLREGLDELGLGSVPVAQGAKEISTTADEYLSDEARRVELVESLRTVVLERHTFSKRAAQFTVFLEKVKAAAKYRRLLLESYRAENELRLRGKQLVLELEAAHAEIANFRARKIVRFADRLGRLRDKR